MSLSFIKELVRSLAALQPDSFERLNSYMITGSKNLECRCDADDPAIPNIGKCEHAWESAKDPHICHRWQFRALTANSTDLSIVETYIIAAELTGDESFVEDEEGRPFFGTVTTFISYFWQAPFASLAAAIDRCHDKGGRPPDAKYWLDILACSQNRHTDEAAERNKVDVGAFQKAIKDSRAVVWLWCEPWFAPGTLKRVWCLDELCAGIDLNYPERGFEMMLSAGEERDMRTTLVERFDAIIRSLAEIDARNARATHEKDRTFVFEKIKARPGGFDEFNKVIGDAMRGWLVATARKALDGPTDAELRSEPWLTRLLARWAALPEGLLLVGVLIVCVVSGSILVAYDSLSDSDREDSIVFTVPLAQAGCLCLGGSVFMSKQRAVRLGAVRPVGKAWLSELVRDTTRGLLVNFALLSLALGPWVVHWAGCTGKSCPAYAVAAFVLPCAGALLVMFSLNSKHIVERADFMLKVAKLASRQSGSLEEARRLLDTLLAFCQEYGMVAHELDTRLEMATLCRTGHAAEDKTAVHDPAMSTAVSTRVHELLDQYGRGWRWVAHTVVKAGGRWSLLGLTSNTRGLGTASYDALIKARLHAALGHTDAALRELRRLCELGVDHDLDSIEGFGGLRNERHAEYSELKQALERNERRSKRESWWRRLAGGIVLFVMLASGVAGVIVVSEARETVLE